MRLIENLVCAYCGAQRAWRWKMPWDTEWRGYRTDQCCVVRAVAMGEVKEEVSTRVAAVKVPKLLPFADQLGV